MKASIGKIAKELGVSRDTLRRWETKGKIIAERTPIGQRRYDLAKILGLFPRAQSLQKNTIGYARVSSHDQKDDLTRQSNVLQSFCVANGWTYEIIQDLGSGLNYQKRGLRKLIKSICSGKDSFKKLSFRCIV